MVGFVIGVVAFLAFSGAGYMLATRRVAASSAFGLRSADTDGDDHIWYLANASVGRVLVWTGAICALISLVAIVYWGEDDIQSALMVTILLVGIAGAIVAVASGLTTARALGKAKQQFPTGMRR
jgi:uncharacterized membrane protein